MFDKREWIKECEAMFNKWYKVTYIPSIQCAVDNRRNPNRYTYYSTKRLRLDNINGWGKGTLFFIDEDTKLVVLDWCQVLCILPANEEKTKENTDV